MFIYIEDVICRRALNKYFSECINIFIFMFTEPIRKAWLIIQLQKILLKTIRGAFFNL